MLIEMDDILRTLKIHCDFDEADIRMLLQALGIHLRDITTRMQQDEISTQDQLNALLHLIEQMVQDHTQTEHVPMNTTHAYLKFLGVDGIYEQTFPMNTEQLMIGRQADVACFDDDYLDPQHAQLRWDEVQKCMTITDMQSANGTFVQVKNRTPLADGSSFLMGRQVMRLEQDTHATEPEPTYETRPMGSPRPTGQWRLIRVGIHDEALAIHPLAEDRPVILGREPTSEDKATLIGFPEDKYMSTNQARLIFEDDTWHIEDTNSSNGVWLAIHGDQALVEGDRVFLGKQLFEVAFDE